MPTQSKSKVYADTPANRKARRVGKPLIGRRTKAELSEDFIHQLNTGGDHHQMNKDRNERAREKAKQSNPEYIARKARQEKEMEIHMKGLDARHEAFLEKMRQDQLRVERDNAKFLADRKAKADKAYEEEERAGIGFCLPMSAYGLTENLEAKKICREKKKQFKGTFVVRHLDGTKERKDSKAKVLADKSKSFGDAKLLLGMSKPQKSTKKEFKPTKPRKPPNMGKKPQGEFVKGQFKAGKVKSD